MKVHENSRKFTKIHDFHEANHSYHCDGLLTSVHGLTLFRDLATVFLCAATCHVFAMRRAVNAGTASKRALDQHVLALQRSVERSYSQGFMIFSVRLSCNFVFMQRIQLEIRFSVFAVKFS